MSDFGSGLEASAHPQVGSDAVSIAGRSFLTSPDAFQQAACRQAISFASR
jgi:hypothetical protein